MRPVHKSSYTDKIATSLATHYSTVHMHKQLIKTNRLEDIFTDMNKYW